jgi:hypothetical protein
VSKEIKLTQNQITIVDDEDYEYLMQWKWHAHKAPHDKGWHVLRKEQKNGKQKAIWMHRVIMNASSGLDVDHKDLNGLNNQKNNLRVCKHFQNMQNKAKQSNNTSGYKGVYLNKRNGKWVAQIKLNYKMKNLGEFQNIIDAAKMYDTKAVELFGEFAVLNFPEG